MIGIDIKKSSYEQISSANKGIAFYALCIVIIIMIAAIIGCQPRDYDIKQEAYRNCTYVCAQLDGGGMTFDDYFTVLHFCNQECKNKFLTDNIEEP